MVVVVVAVVVEVAVAAAAAAIVVVVVVVVIIVVVVVVVVVHCVSEKTTLRSNTDVTHYRFNPHQPISVIFGRDVAEGVCY